MDLPRALAAPPRLSWLGRRLAELAAVAALVALCVPSGVIRQRGQQLRGRVGGYLYEIDTNSAVVNHLRVEDVWLPKTLRLAWDYSPLGSGTPQFDVQRREGGSGSWTDLGTTTNHYYHDSDISLDTYTEYRVSVYDENVPSAGLPAPPAGADAGDILNRTYGDGTLFVSLHVTVVQTATTENQTVDSRIDPRYSTVHYKDFLFGSRVYQGGLYAGYAADASKVGRTYLKFSLPSLPSGEALWCASVNGSVTKTFADSTTHVGCQILSDITWTAPTLKWTAAPAFDPTTPGATSTVTASGSSLTIDNGASYIATSTNWAHWNLPEGLWLALTGSGGCSAAIASTSESSSGWVYFAKKEFDTAQTACVLHAYGGPIGVLGLNIDPSDVAQGSTTTGTVTLNADAPAGGVSVALAVLYDPMYYPTPPTVPSSVTVPGGQRTATFTVNASSTASLGTYVVLATLNGSAGANVAVTSP